MNTILKRTIALGVAGVIALATAAPGYAGPLPSNIAALKNAVPTDVVDVRYRRWRRSAFPAVVLGMFGAFAAAAAADAYWSRHYADPGPYVYGPYRYRHYDYAPHGYYGPHGPAPTVIPW